MLFIGGDMDGERQEVDSDAAALEYSDMGCRFLFDDHDGYEEATYYYRREICGVEVMVMQGMDEEDAARMLIENYPS